MSAQHTRRHIRLLRGVTLKILYPLLMLLGSLKKDKKEALQRFVIHLNNKLVLKEDSSASKILVLLPHCLQVSQCDIRITNNIYNCKRCGRCKVGGLVSLAEKNNIELHVATGGSLARKIVMDVRPHAIVAVACERDLSSGIADSYPLRVLGIENERPKGPCVDTLVDVAKVEEAIKLLIA